MTQRTVLLIDGDTLAFRAASACQHTIESPSGMIEMFSRRTEGEAILDNMIDRIRRRLKADDMVFYLSCPGPDNWRLKVEPTYKANRKGSIRPQLLDPLKDYLRLNYGATHLAFLEADDALGIAATAPQDWDSHPDLFPPGGRRIVVGRDKDFKTIPGLHYQLLDDDGDGEPIVREITPQAAQEAHYVQALSGDAVDGYPGCPGIGKTRAERIVAEPIRLVPKAGVITRGINKGQEVTKWHEAGPCSIWEAVVCNYEKAGLSETEALKTARIARILLWGEYDLETHAVTLWVPREDD